MYNVCCCNVVAFNKIVVDGTDTNLYTICFEPTLLAGDSECHRIGTCVCTVPRSDDEVQANLAPWPVDILG